MVARTVDIAGIDHVGIGTDRSHNHGAADYDWMRKGRWTRGVDYGAGSAARPWQGAAGRLAQGSVGGSARSRAGSRAVGFSPAEVDKITHKNWLRVYADTFAGG